MKSTDDRKLFGTPIGAAAVAGNIAVIPQTQATAGDGTASVALGFPPETFIARAAGGEPPRGQDMNGLLNLLSSAVQVLQAGYLGPFNSAFAQGIGGYPAGAIVSGSTAGTFWVSTADANVSTPGATGATWQSLFNGYATQAWASGQFLQLANSATQTVTGPVTFSGITTVPTPTDYTQKQAIGASDADARYGRLSDRNTWTGDQNITGILRILGGNDLVISNASGDRIQWRENTDSIFGVTAALDIIDSDNNRVGYYVLPQNGIPYSNAGTFALTSQLPHTTYSGNAGDAGSYTITVYTDPSTPSGKRYRISGQTAAYTEESRQTLSLPITLNGVLPGAWGATTFWVTNTSSSANDQFAQIIGTPSVSSITVNIGVSADATTTWPAYATWWLEGY